MLTKHVFWGKYFGKSVFGHFFCPISIFPKYFPGKKHDIFGSSEMFIFLIVLIILKSLNYICNGCK